MLTPVRSGRFKKDVKLAEKRGKDLTKLRDILLLLLEGAALPPDYRDQCEWKGFRDLHIEPDWLLIYRIEGEELQLARTGSHADLFDE